MPVSGIRFTLLDGGHKHFYILIRAVGCDSTYTWLLEVDRHIFAKWFFRPHLWHSRPVAGHDCWRVCRFPHLVHCCLWLSVCTLPLCLLLSIGHVSSVSVGCFGRAAVARCFICEEVASFDLQMSIAFASDRSGSLKSLLLVLSSRIPQTMQSLMRLSDSTPNSHDFTFVFRSVTY